MRINFLSRLLFFIIVIIIIIIIIIISSSSSSSSSSTTQSFILNRDFPGNPCEQGPSEVEQTTRSQGPISFSLEKRIDKTLKARLIYRWPGYRVNGLFL